MNEPVLIIQHSDTVFGGALADILLGSKSNAPSTGKAKNDGNQSKRSAA